MAALPCLSREASPAPRGEAAARVLSEARAEAGRGAAAAPAEARAEDGREAAAALAEAEPTERRLVDRPLVAWLIEIACIGSVAWLRSQVPAPDHSSACGAALRTLATSLATVEGCTLAHAVLVHKVYAHVPPFSAPAPQARPPTWRGVLSDWLACNLPVHVLAVGLSALAARGRRAGGGARAPRAWLASLRRLRLGPFLVKLVVARLVADVTFYVLHRALHTKMLYGRFHKRHHEHKAPGLHTNFHFTVPDLFIEGVLPIVAALFSLRPLLGVFPKPVEMGLLHVCLQWYEIGSHSGKPVPTVSYLPPLAPLYRAVFGDVDKRNVEFHHAHHAHTHCNYGITQWLDHALGTARCAGSPP